MFVLPVRLNWPPFCWTTVCHCRKVSAWRPAIAVGVLSLCGSLGWAWAFTLESAVKVRTLGQVELVIAFLVARFRLGERHSPVELAASGLVLLGILLVTLLG